MKNLLKSLALVAVSALAVVSCQKDELASQNDGEGVFFSLKTGDAGKTYIVVDGKNYKPQWAQGDEIGVLFEGFASDKTAPAGKLTNSNESGDEANFEGTIKDAPEEGNLYAFYPSKVAKTYGSQTAGFDILDTQHPTATSFDPAADLLISKPVDFIADETAVVIGNVQFARALAMLKINVYSEDVEAIQEQYLSKLTVTAVGGRLAGRPVFDLTKGDAKITKYNTDAESVSAEYEEDLVCVGNSATATGCSVFLMVAPVTLNKDAKLKFTGATDEYTITKEVTLPGDVVLTPGKCTEINLSLAEENCEKKEDVDYSGDWMIVSENEKDGVTTHYAMPAYTSGNNIRAVTYTLTAEGKAKSTETDLNDCLYVVEKVTDGTYKGYYTIQDANGLYLYAAGTGTSNYLKGNATLQNDAKYYWDITCPEEGVYSIVAKSTNNNNNLRFNYNNGSPMFSCYATGKQAAVSLFPFKDVVVDTTPVIEVSSNTLTIEADGKVKGNPIKVKLNKYVTGPVTVVISDQDAPWLSSAAVVEGELVVEATQNKTANVHTAKITLSYTGAESVVITATQEAAEIGAKMTIDFEQETTAYTEWDWNGMTSKQKDDTKIIAHSGSYYGTTGGKASASITTKAKVRPQSLTFYVTKESTNTTASTWKVQVSNDGLSWTDVVSQDATSMDKGTWVEVKADLSSYSDVFVRILYSGSTAVRDIDDVKLVYHSVASLAISGTATKKDYKVGDSFEPTGLTVKATYTDSSEKDVTADAEWTVTPATLALNTTSVSVVASFGGVSTEPKQIDGIKVTEAAALNSISVKTAPAKVTYKEGENFDPAGLVITRNYSDATSDDYAYAGHESEFAFSPALTTALATTDNKVTITYKEKSVDQAITVEDTSLKTMDEIFAAATKAGSTATPVKIKFTDCVVTGVSGNNAYLTDANGTKGLIIYGKDHGFEAGDKLNGKVDCKVQLYRGSTELTELKSTTTGLTVTKDGTVTPQTISIANLSGVNTGALVKYENLSYTGSDNVFTDGENNITLYNTFMTLPTFDKTKKYNITGVYIQYNTTKEIAPRTGADIEAIEVPYIKATPSKTSVAADGETISVTVETNVASWTVESSDPTNFAISGKAASSFNVVVAENTDTQNDREATITVKAEGAENAVFTLKQVKKGGSATPQTVTYKQTSTSAASVSSGTAPSGSSVTFSNTYNVKDQLTKDNSMTYTLKGYAGKKITAISMSMHSNKSAGTGKFSLRAGTTTLAEIASNTGFNQKAWYGAWSQSYVTVTPTMKKTDYVIKTGEDVVLTISASANSLFCESITITYE